MKSRCSREFWRQYSEMPGNVKDSADKAFSLWVADSTHPSLHFKLISAKHNVWSARVTGDYRALCVKRENCWLWVYIGEHDFYFGGAE